MRRRNPTARSLLLPRSGAGGQALVELALIVPVMLLLLLIAVDFGRLFFSYVEINNAAREGAQFASVSPTDCGGTPCLSTSGIATHASQERNSQVLGGGAAGITVTLTCAKADGTATACSNATVGGAGTGNTVTVNAQQNFSFLTPLINQFFNNNLQVSASTTAVVLGFAASGGGTPPVGCSLPTASFEVTVTSGRTVFANPSASTPSSGICNLSGYNWTWGGPGALTDGVPLDEDPPGSGLYQSVGSATGDSYTYAGDGTYQITLVVTNQAGSSTTTRTITVPKTVTVTCQKPTANFDWTVPSNKTYRYRDQSTVTDAVHCPITDWLWTFTDKGNPPLQSNAQNPADVTYGNNSSHPVTLTVTNLGGSTTITLNG